MLFGLREETIKDFTRESRNVTHKTQKNRKKSIKDSISLCVCVWLCIEQCFELFFTRLCFDAVTSFTLFSSRSSSSSYLFRFGWFTQKRLFSIRWNYPPLGSRIPNWEGDWRDDSMRFYYPQRKRFYQKENGTQDRRRKIKRKNKIQNEVEQEWRGEKKKKKIIARRNMKVHQYRMLLL